MVNISKTKNVEKCIELPDKAFKKKPTSINKRINFLKKNAKEIDRNCSTPVKLSEYVENVNSLSNVIMF